MREKREAESKGEGEGEGRRKEKYPGVNDGSVSTRTSRYPVSRFCSSVSTAMHGFLDLLQHLCPSVARLQ